MSAPSLKVRQKAILAGLYLSRFDGKGLEALGFKGFHEAFNVIGYAIKAKPASIKNYRDEFDPYFLNQRKGWHLRKLRDYCKKVMDDFSGVSFDDFTDLIKGFLIENYEVEEFLGKIGEKNISDSVAKRLITGKAAEEYFKLNYQSQEEFVGYSCKETTNLGCGFDFRLENNSNFYCIEVKGLSTKTGSFILTEKEYSIAGRIKDRYCLYVVLNFSEKPYHKMFFNPLQSALVFKKVEREILSINYSSNII
jgi:hypothetical protein